jgi:hypothetical protein
MFTIGREREKKHAQGYITKPADVALIHTVIDAVHDVLDGILTPESSMPILTEAFGNGGSGVWEKTAGWIRKLTAEHPAVGGLWAPIARHPSARIRFRVGACLEDMPSLVRAEIFPLLLNDSSAKVRAKVASDRGLAVNASELALLTARRSQETDPGVLEAIDYALSMSKAPQG